MELGANQALGVYIRNTSSTASSSVAALTLLVASRILAQVPEPAFTIRITTGSTIFQSGGEIRLQILLTNNSSHDIEATRGHGDVLGEEAGYRIHVLDAEGKPAPETSLLRVMNGEDYGPPLYTKTGFAIPLAPGKTLSDGMIVNKFYDLRKPGTYTIQVERYIDWQTKDVAYSNSITVTVTPEVSPQPCRLPNGEICEDYLKGLTFSRLHPPPFSLTIEADNSPVESRSPVWISATVKNISGYPLKMSIAHFADEGDYVYKVSAVDAKGVSAPETQYGRRIQGHETPEAQEQDRYVINSSSSDYTLLTYQTLTDKVEVTKLFDLSVPGRYSIQFQKFDPETSTYVRSNVVIVTVTPPRQLEDWGCLSVGLE
jgi:hypothetical protein